MTIVRVKHNGRITIPAALRGKLNIDDGTTLNVVEHDEGVFLQVVAPLEAGEPVGDEEYHKIIAELEAIRNLSTKGIKTGEAR